MTLPNDDSANTNIPGDGTDDGGDLQAKIADLQNKIKLQSDSITKLTSKNDELIGENRKRTRIERLLKAIEIDPTSEEAEDLLVQKLSAALGEQADALKAAAKPPAQPSGDSGSVTPQDLDMKHQLAKLQKKLTDMEKKAQEAEEREKAAVEKRKRDYVELKVKEALQKAGCVQPSHFFKLQASAFRLSDDGETVIGGPEHDPRSLEDAIESFKDDNEWSMYFRGSGASGSGMVKGQGGFGGQSLKNPFRVDQLNVTEAARILSKDAEKGKRLILEARSAGKLDPKFASFAGV